MTLVDAIRIGRRLTERLIGKLGAGLESPLIWTPVEDVELSRSMGKKVIHYELTETHGGRVLMTDDLDGTWTLMTLRDDNVLDLQTGFKSQDDASDWYAKNRAALWPAD